MKFTYIITENITILHEAIESGYEQVIQLLLQENKYDVNCIFYKTKEYPDCYTSANMHYFKETHITLLHSAIKRGYIEIIKLLLSDPNLQINLKSITTIDKSSGCVLYTSSSKEIAKSSIYFAINNENTKLIQLLLDQPQIDINSGICESNKNRYDKKILLFQY